MHIMLLRLLVFIPLRRIWLLYAGVDSHQGTGPKAFARDPSRLLVYNGRVDMSELVANVSKYRRRLFIIIIGRCQSVCKNSCEAYETGRREQLDLDTMQFFLQKIELLLLDGCSCCPKSCLALLWSSRAPSAGGWNVNLPICTTVSIKSNLTGLNEIERIAR